jgi:hypothetical protein
VRDFGALHERLVPGFVVASRVEGDADEHVVASDRVITFASGAVARERLVSVDEERRRLVYAVIESGLGFSHHQAIVEVRAPVGAADGCHLVWTTDFLPEDPAPVVDALMAQGATAMQRALGVV